MPAKSRGSVRWLLIFWIFVISAISFLDRVNISIAGKLIANEYHLDNLHLGYIFSAFLLGYAAFQAPGGWLADRFGPRRTLLGATVWWGIFTALTAAVPMGMSGVFFALYAVRLSLGAGEAVMYPSSNRLVAAWIPSSERGIANGWIFAGVGAGAGITPPLITYILLNYGWRWSFYASSVIGLGAGVVWWIICRDTPGQHPWVKPSERDHIEAGLPQTAASLKEPAKGIPWDLILTREVLAMTASYFAYGYAAWIFFSWFFIYLNSVRNLDMKSSALYSMLPFIGMAVASPLGGWISDRLTKRYGRRIGRCGIAVVGMALAAIFITLGTRVESAQLASIVLAGGAGAMYLAQSSFWSVTADVAGRSAGTVSGVMNMGAQVGGFVTAWMTPLVSKHFGWNASFLVAAALCLGGALLWLVVNPEREIIHTPTPEAASGRG